jgi:DNA-binding MarR family transcriptional regulator
MSAELQSALIDIVLWLYRGFFVPGDQLLSNVPGLYFASHGRVVSGLVSAAIWATAFVVLVVVYRFVRDLDRTLTALLVRLYEETQRAARVVARRLGIAFRSYRLEREARATRTEVAELPALSALQLGVLRSHAGLPPAHLLTPNEIASALDVRSADVEQALALLRKLSLVERSFGAGDGEDGYRLTRAGEALLAAYSRPQASKGSALPERPKRIEPRLGSV